MTSRRLALSTLVSSVFSLVACGTDAGAGLTTFGSGSPTATSMGTSSAGTDGSSETVSTTGGDSGATSGDASAGGSTSGAATSETDGLKFDTPDGASATGAITDGSMGCEKADFLFVIDNSGSMQEEQANLVASFPGFINAIKSTIQAADYHIMVTDTDTATCCDTGGEFWSCDGFACSNLPPPPADPCRNLLGAGVVHPWGNQASGMDCGIAGGNRWMTHVQPDLEGTFACAASVGTSGDINEQQVQAALAAVSDGMNGPGQCNEGFLRDDAILVVVIITDEESSENGNIQQWHDTLVAAKNGDENAIVMLGIVGDADQPNGLCTSGEASPQLRQFIGSFPNSSFGSVCAPDFAPFLVDAVDVVDLTCDSFVPPG